MMLESWERFFDEHAPYYMLNRFTANTKAEVDFILEELNLPSGSSILDMGCGTGRHSIEFAKRGYQVTGVDISSGMLMEAEKKAREEGVVVEWVRSDVAGFRSSKLFDAAVCLCEGAFGLLNPGDDVHTRELDILHSIASALKVNSRLILTTPNGFAKIREITQEDVEAGRFDLVRMVEEITTIDLPEGIKKVRLRQKFYTPPELAEYLGQAGFETEQVRGGTAGEWGRRKIRLDEIEFMVIARRTK
jgi:2-polyprenyl-3-methyl-5-hydroxy-6-metoxy-1,4-benzoquinol methylase